MAITKICSQIVVTELHWLVAQLPSQCIQWLLPVLKNIGHEGVIQWKHFPRFWPVVRGIHRSPGNSQHKGQWRRALMFSLICVWINGWVNNSEAGDLRCRRAHYDVTVMGGGKIISSICASYEWKPSKTWQSQNPWKILAWAYYVCSVNKLISIYGSWI